MRWRYEIARPVKYDAQTSRTRLSTDSASVASRNESYMPAKDAPSRSSAVADERTANILEPELIRRAISNARPSGSLRGASSPLIESEASNDDDTLPESTELRVFAILSATGLVNSPKVVAWMENPGGTVMPFPIKSANDAALLPTTEGS